LALKNSAGSVAPDRAAASAAPKLNSLMEYALRSGGLNSAGRDAADFSRMSAGAGGGGQLSSSQRARMDSFRELLQPKLTAPPPSAASSSLTKVLSDLGLGSSSPLSPLGVSSASSGGFLDRSGSAAPARTPSFTVPPPISTPAAPQQPARILSPNPTMPTRRQ
jgi:hypothetical protein